MLRSLVLVIAAVLIAGCDLFGHSSVEIAPYTVLAKDNQFELRHYEKLVLVKTKMSDLDESKSPFYKLFNYISGNNSGEQKIAMTAPVFMDQSEDQSEAMSFVLPDNVSLEDAPLPQDPSVSLEELRNYTVATIQFSGRLKQQEIQKQRVLLKEWIDKKQLTIIGKAKSAGYNPPFTLPAMRRNEILIPVEKPG